MWTILLNFEPGTMSESDLAQIQALAPDKRLLETHDRNEIERVLDDIEIAAAGFPRDLLAKARNLRWLQQWKPGRELIDLIVNPRRPGRVEPRVVKRRVRQYPLMTEPREILRNRMVNPCVAS